jgi:hypothetical protein
MGIWRNWIAQLASNEKVEGSTPSMPTIFMVIESVFIIWLIVPLIAMIGRYIEFKGCVVKQQTR